MICLTSGRFDPPHVGHVISLQLLGQRYEKVVVVILDHADQYYPVAYRLRVLEDVLTGSIGAYDVLVNKTHFGEIDKKSLLEYNADVYVCGNLSVLKHIEGLGMPVEYQDRSYQYHATDDRKWQLIKSHL